MSGPFPADLDQDGFAHVRLSNLAVEDNGETVRLEFHQEKTNSGFRLQIPRLDAENLLAALYHARQEYGWPAQEIPISRRKET